MQMPNGMPIVLFHQIDIVCSEGGLGLNEAERSETGRPQISITGSAHNVFHQNAIERYDVCWVIQTAVQK